MPFLIKHKYTLLLFLLLHTELFSQSRLIINNGGYLVMSGGTSGTPMYLVIENSAINAITRVTSGHIISEKEFDKVKWNVRTTVGSFTIPLGVGTTYIPFIFNKTTAGTESSVGTVSASSWGTAANAILPSGGVVICNPGAADENRAIDRFWVIDVSGYSANPTADITFYYDAADLDAIPEADLQAQRWNSASGSACKWVVPPVGTVDAVNNFVSVTGVSDFSPWTLVNRSAPLPIDLIEFQAKCDKGVMLIEWSTASETNSDYFVVERGSYMAQGNGILQFAEIGTVKGAGNSPAENRYSFVDSSLSFEYRDKVYYRLKQVDFDGKYEYFKTIDAGCIRDVHKLQIIHTSFENGNNSVKFYAPSEGTCILQLADILGRVLFSKEIANQKGINTYKLNIPELAQGIYIISLVSLINDDFAVNKLFSKK